MFKNKGRSIFTLLVIFTLIFFMCPGYHTAIGSQEIKPDIFKRLRYRHIGPRGNRVSAVYGIPDNPNVYYAGAAAGGIFKTTDGGNSWTPIFDDQKALAIGSLAVASSDSNIIWAGTGETWFRNENSYQPIGNGIYKSIDGGKTWTHAGLEKTARIGRIVIDPEDPNIVFAAAMGHCDGPQEERGVFRTMDGGKSWERVLFVDENTGCSDIAMDPNNPRILFAGMWQTVTEFSGGPGSGLYLSKDRGSTWKKLSGHGLPYPPVGKIGVAIAPSNSSRIYALIETGGGLPFKGKETSSGVLWMSDDGGESWELVSYDPRLNGRAAYYTRCLVGPNDQNEVYFMSAQLSVSVDGGKTVKRLVPPRLHGDHHDMWIDPTNGDRIIEANDAGVDISVNRGETWQEINLPIAQMYSVSVDNQIPYFVYGNLQDWYSQRGPSNSLLGGPEIPRGGIPRGMWHGVGGGEAGRSIPDPVDNNIIWSTAPLERYDLSTGLPRSVNVWPDNVSGWSEADLKYRFYWNYPLAISPHDHNKVYVGSQYVHQTTDGGHSWKVISPDLSTNNKARQRGMDSLTPQHYTFECIIIAIAESPLEEGLIWAGTNDGFIQLTRDGGTRWTNVTSNVPNLPPWGVVRNIEPSRYDPGTCYIVVDFHEEGNRDPYVYKTADYGKSWKSISSDIPKSVFSYTRCIREDPVRSGLLYLGTENALYVSFNDGSSWLPLQTNLPHAPVHGLVVQENFNDLVVGTHGRGFWILDDITPLQNLTPEVLESDVYLFPLRPAYRFHSSPSHAPEVQQGDPSVGENPPYGASINYYLKADETAQVKISIFDERGQKIRTLNGSKNSGINRVWWNLRQELSKAPRLRTSPLYAPWIEVGSRGWRPLRGGQMTILAPPGHYLVRLSVGEKESSQEILVKKDPHSSGSEEDIQAQTKLLLEIRDNVESVVEMINQLEWMRKQIYDLDALLEGDKDAESILAAGKELDKKIILFEDNLYQRKVRGKSKFINQLQSLVRNVSSADFPPTTQEIELHEILKAQLETYQNQFNELLKKDLPAFNRLLKEKNIPHTITAKAPEVL